MESIDDGGGETLFMSFDLLVRGRFLSPLRISSFGGFRHFDQVVRRDDETSSMANK